jgi:methionine-rich copper-binding protein CopC
MSSKLSIVLSSVLELLSMPVSGGLAWAHAFPAVSIPNNGSTVKASLRVVRIQFTEAIENTFSQITVKGQNGEVVSQAKLRQLGDDALVIDLKPLRPGNYTVEWQVLSVDTHVTEGLLRFTVRAAGK